MPKVQVIIDDLQGEVIDLGNRYVVEVAGSEAQVYCPYCEADTPYKHGVKQQHFVDIPHDGKPTLLRIERVRWRCRSCRKTFFSPIKALDGNRKATARFVEYVEHEAARKTFAQLARETGTDEKTIKNIFDESVSRLRKATRPVTPKFMGIGAIKIGGIERCIVSDVDAQTIYDLLPNFKAADLAAYFSKMPDKQNIKIVMIGLSDVAKDLVSEQLPSRDIIISPCNMMKLADDAVDLVRKDIRKLLNSRQRMKLSGDKSVLTSSREALTNFEKSLMDGWFKMHPRLESAYSLKEGFRTIYDGRSKAAAMDLVTQLINEMPEDLKPVFDPVLLAFSHSSKEIFNTLDHPAATRFTPSAIELGRNIAQLGRGYSFEAMRARIMYESQARKSNKLGPYIPTLSKLLQLGFFA